MPDVLSGEPPIGVCDKPAVILSRVHAGSTRSDASKNHETRYGTRRQALSLHAHLCGMRLNGRLSALRFRDSLVEANKRGRLQIRETG